MCGRIIQASGPLRYKLVDGLDVPDSRQSNIPRRYNGAPTQELLVIRQNHETGERASIKRLLFWCRSGVHVDAVFVAVFLNAAGRSGGVSWSPSSDCLVDGRAAAVR